MEQGEDRYQGHSGDQAGGHSSGRGEDQREVRPGEQGGRGTGGAPDKQGRHAPLAGAKPRGRAHDVEILGNTLTLTSTDTDAVAALLLSEHLAKDLEITSRGLEDAFVALTSDDTTFPTPGPSA